MYQYEDWDKIKSWKFADWELKTKREYKTVIKISKEIICTKPLMVLITAYLDWLTRPNIEKKIFDNNIKIRWYKIIESIESTRNKEGPQIKFNENSNCDANKRDRNIGAITLAGRGIINISFDNILNKSARIWKAPLRPINVGPIRLWAKAKSLRSVNITNKVNKTSKNEDNSANSCKI